MAEPEAEGVERTDGESRDDEADEAAGPRRDAAEEGAAEARADEAASVDVAELAEAAEVVERLAAELEELRDRHLRLAAEFENYRKRTRQELLKTRELGQAELAGRLLDALDDLARIAEAPADGTTVEALHQGVELVERKLLKELADAGLKPIDAAGKRFDPNEHEALSSVPTADPEEDEVVAEVFVPGYRFRDRLLRPARVVVKTYQADADGSDGA